MRIERRTSVFSLVDEECRVFSNTIQITLEKDKEKYLSIGKEIQKRGEIHIPDNVWVKDEDFLELF